MWCSHRHLKIIDCLSLFTVPATSAAQNSLLFFFFLLRLLTELISKQGRPWAIYFTPSISMDAPHNIILSGVVLRVIYTLCNIFVMLSTFTMSVIMQSVVAPKHIKYSQIHSLKWVINNHGQSYFRNNM